MIAILGSGISGLMTAWACITRGRQFVIYTKNPEKPKTFGLEYLHEPCDLAGLRSDKLEKIFVPFCLDREEFSKRYSFKVYGDNSVPRSRSVEYFVDETIYSMPDAIDVIWPLVAGNIVEEHIRDFNDIENIIKFHKDVDLVLSTIPLSNFKAVIEKDAYVDISKTDYSKNFCIYNARDNTPVYRSGVIFGQSFAESVLALSKDSILIHKIFGSVELPKINKVKFIGRYGKHDKSVLAHDVYHEVCKLLDEGGYGQSW